MILLDEASSSCNSSVASTDSSGEHPPPSHRACGNIIQVPCSEAQREVTSPNVLVRLRVRASEQTGIVSGRYHRIEVESIVLAEKWTREVYGRHTILDYPAADTNRRETARGEQRNKRSWRTTPNCSGVARVYFKSRVEEQIPGRRSVPTQQFAPRDSDRGGRKLASSSSGRLWRNRIVHPFRLDWWFILRRENSK